MFLFTFEARQMITQEYIKVTVTFQSTLWKRLCVFPEAFHIAVFLALIARLWDVCLITQAKVCPSTNAVFIFTRFVTYVWRKEHYRHKYNTATAESCWVVHHMSNMTKGKWINRHWKCVTEVAFIVIFVIVTTMNWLLLSKYYNHILKHTRIRDLDRLNCAT